MNKALKITAAALAMSFAVTASAADNKNTNVSASAKAAKTATNAKQSAEGNFKIGVIDIRKVMASANEAKAIGEKLKKEFQKRESELLALDKSLKEQAEKLQRNRAIMSEAERSKLEREVASKQRDLQRMQQNFREDANTRQQEEMQAFLLKVRQSVNELAKKDGFDLILLSDAVPYASEKVDITQKLLKKLNG